MLYAIKIFLYFQSPPIVYKKHFHIQIIRIDVNTLESVDNAKAGKAFRSIFNLHTNSAAICCASAALPPFPIKISFYFVSKY